MSRSLRVALWPVTLLVGIASTAWAAKKEPPKPAAAPPDVKLTVTRPSAGGAWTMEVANTGGVPLHLDADARLLRLEITPIASASASASASGKKKPAAPKTPPHFTCELPAAMRTEGRSLVLEPGKRYLEVFDPRLFCLDETTKLGAGAKVTATLGWAPGKGALAPPFVVAPVVSASASASASASDRARVASAKEIAAPELDIPAHVISSPSASTSTSTSASASAVAKVPPPPKPVMVAKGGSARSVYDGKDAAVSIVVTNESASTTSLYARPQVIGVFVRGPRGERTKCEPQLLPAPIVDFVVTLAPGASWTGDTRLDSLCPQGTFDRPGLYELWPVLHATALPWKPTAFSGDVRAVVPQLLRVETGKLPFHDAPPIAAPVPSSSSSP
jgi:hypothetical protein